jgi:hypothetical protein
VVAILSGFSIAIIIYCVGRLDNLKREYIPRLDAVAKEAIRYYKSEGIEINPHEAKKRKKELNQQCLVNSSNLKKCING